jgi:serine/threonine protein kinase
VKPANIMLLDQDDWVVVTDFGLAKLDEGDQLTLSGHVVGTPRYMCPEYFESGKISNASDQYALGVVAFELLTGEVPFGGNTVGELMRGHLLDAIPSVRALRPELPEALDEILARMLAKDPDARYANIGDAIAALRAATVIGPSLEEATEIIRTPSSGVRLRLASSGAWRAVRRRPGFAAIVGATVLVVSLATVASKQGEVSAADPSVLDSLGAGGEGAGAADRGESPRATAPEERTAATPPSIGPRPAAPDPSSASLNTPVTAPPPQVPSATGTILIGSRLPLAALYVGDGRPRIIGEQGVQTITADAGPVRLSIRVDGCVAWDTTFTVSGGGRHTIGYRAPRC